MNDWTAAELKEAMQIKTKLEKLDAAESAEMAKASVRVAAKFREKRDAVRAGASKRALEILEEG